MYCLFLSFFSWYFQRLFFRGRLHKHLCLPGITRKPFTPENGGAPGWIFPLFGVLLQHRVTLQCIAFVCLPQWSWFLSNCSILQLRSSDMKSLNGLFLTQTLQLSYCNPPYLYIYTCSSLLIYLYVFLPTYIFIHVPPYLYIYTCSSLLIYLYMFLPTYIFIHVPPYLYIYTCSSLLIYLYMFLPTYIFIHVPPYLYIYTCSSLLIYLYMFLPTYIFIHVPHNSLPSN